MAAGTRYQSFDLRAAAFYGALAVAGAVACAALLAAWFMEYSGHWVTGMDNQTVWGLPHVFAIFLIVAASGALNVASIGTVFGCSAYKPLGRLSGLLAIALLVGGLSVLVLDLGRPDRLVVAMTHYNFTSIFAWNIFLYTGFLAVTALYLWTMMEQPMNRWSFCAGLAAFLWRLVLTTGTGLIFGVLVAREAYDVGIMAPLFIATSFALGLACFILVLAAVQGAHGRALGDAPVRRLGRLLGIFVAVVLIFVAALHFARLAAGFSDTERFILVEGGVITALFWGGQIILGGLLPLVLLFSGGGRGRLLLAAGLVILGGFAQLYVIIIGGQAVPLTLFPGMVVTSSFFDGQVAAYIPSLPEFGLGLGGIAIAALIALIGFRNLSFLPANLADPESTP